MQRASVAKGHFGRQFWGHAGFGAATCQHGSSPCLYILLKTQQRNGLKDVVKLFMKTDLRTENNDLAKNT